MSVRVAVIGAGRFGEVHIDAFNQLAYTGVAELGAVAEANAGRAAELRGKLGCPVYTDFREMLEKEDLDAVGIATPDHLHRDIAVAVARAGKHLLVEKPLDVTVEGCDAVIAAAKAAGVLLQVDFHKRYDPDHQAIEALVGAGELGDPLYGAVCMEDKIEIPTRWFPHWAAVSSPAWFLGVHFYDLVRWILKSDAKTVYATGAKSTLLNDYGIDAFDCVNAKVLFESGATFNFDTSWVIPNGFEAVVNQEMRIVGTKGLVECDSQYRGLRSCTAAKGMSSYNNSFRRESFDKQGRRVTRGYGVESIQDFVANVAILKNGGVIGDLQGCWASGEDGMEATRIAAGVHESVSTGKVVELR